ncbi:MAG: hypothetical protein UY18_C0001G0008 [Microgenomates group bacterium GW2011_GWF2_47_9]|nr:MAG: hypothetical protein UY18_C0001G0008 [Microgenomates group bacterium GW2011_GWF2_47_9]
MTNSCPQCQSSGNSGFSAGVLLGIVLGGAGGYLLWSEKGQELLDSLKSGASEKILELAENPAIADKLADLETTMRQARATLQNTAEGAESKIHSAATFIATSTAPTTPKKTFFRRMGASLGK